MTHASSAVTTFLFTDIEGSSRLWEHEPERMRSALAAHDALARQAVTGNRGVVVKMIGDGMHAVFDDPVDAINAAVQLQRALADVEVTHGVALHVRCGMHVGAFERRDNDFFGPVVNRAARIMSAAHGGQVLVSQAVAVLANGRLGSGIALRDLGTLRLRDLAQPEHVHQVLHPELRRDFPALRSLEAVPNNLPQQLTAFVGRERETAEVVSQLGRSRLLTLVGTGGLGKTRMSLQVGAGVLDDYPDGVWFIELAPLRDAQRVPQAVASVLGVVEEAGHSVIEALLKFVKERRLLLILDNCEHLLAACAELAKLLLQTGTASKVLASSREPLHVSGESVFMLPALAVPSVRQAMDVAAMLQVEAVRLFVDRAVAALPTFRLTPENAAVVAGICNHLDGIPLALELAAARVRALSVEEIGTRLGDRFRLLRRGDPTLLPRQQTLRASIDWSYELLSPGERLLLARLSVFAGGWTLDAAEAVGAGGAIAAPDVLDLLDDLVEKSLVEWEPDRRRYRLLETMQRYAEERLQDADDSSSTRDRHLRHYLALAERASEQLVGPEQGAWLASLDAERENLLTAHAWCGHATGGAELGLRLAFAVKLYMINRGLLALLHRIAIEALTRPGADTRRLPRCRVLHTTGQLDCFMGRYDEALRYLAESLEIAREIGDKGRETRVLQDMALASLGRGDSAAARQSLEEAIALAHQGDDKRGLAAALSNLAQLHRSEGELDAAEPLYRNALQLAREMGDSEVVGVVLLNLAMVSIGRNVNDVVPDLLLEVLTIAEEISSKPAGRSAIEVCAGLAAASKEWARAARMFGIAEANEGSAYSIRRDPTDEAFLAPLAAAAREALGELEFVRAADAGRSLAYDDAMIEARIWLVDRR